MLGLPSLPVIGIVVAVLLSVGGGVGYKVGHPIGYRSGYADGYKTGVAAMAAEVERRNAAAAEAARRAKGSVDQCWTQGGRWSQERGECEE